MGLPNGWNVGPGPTVATRPTTPRVLHAHSNATTENDDRRLIIVTVYVAGSQRTLRALLDSGAMENSFARRDYLCCLRLSRFIRSRAKLS